MILAAASQKQSLHNGWLPMPQPNITKLATPLQNNGIEWKTVTIDRCRPDLTKFDALLEQIATMSTVASTTELIETESDIQEIQSADGDEEFVMIE